MIKHIVFFKTKPNHSKADLDAMAADFRKLGSTTPYIKNFSIGEDFSHRGSFDLALCCDFDNEDDLKRYGANEEHQRLIHHVIPNVCEDKREIIDFSY